MRYRNVVRVLDYQEFRNKCNSNIVDVPEPELYIEDGPLVFPVANATRKSLVDGSVLERAAARGALPDIPLREVPFPPEDSGLPSLKDPKARGVYITVERRARRANKASKLATVFEYACSPNSMLGRVNKELGVPHVRLSKEELDIQNPIVAAQPHEQLRLNRLI